MPESTNPETEPSFPKPDEAKDHHVNDIKPTEGNTKGPTNNPIHPPPTPRTPHK